MKVSLFVKFIWYFCGLLACDCNLDNSTRSRKVSEL